MLASVECRFEARGNAEEEVRVANRGEERGIIWKLARGALAEGVEAHEERVVRGACRGNFVAHAFLHGCAQGGFEAREFVRVFRAQVHLHGDARGNRIDRRATSDGAEIEGAARGLRMANRGEAYDAARNGGDGIGRAEVGPTVAAGTRDGDFQAARGDSLRGDVVGGGTVHGDDSGEAWAVAFDKRANAAQIAFTLLAHVAGEKNRLRGADGGFGERAGQAGEGSETGGIIGDTRADEARAIALHADVRAGGENRVEMRDEEDGGGIGGGALGNHIAGGIGVHGEAGCFEEFFEKLAAGSLVRFRRGNFGEANLLVCDPVRIFHDPGEGAGAGGVLREFGDGVFRGAR